MKQIPLRGTNGKGRFLICSEESFEELNKYKWLLRKDGYVSAYSLGSGRKGSKVMIHRLVTNAPVGKVVDHINGDKLDNRIENLRICTQSQNLMNRKKTRGTSKYKGVSWSKIVNKWVVHIRIDSKGHTLGYFIDEESAAKTYDTKAKELFGEFASLNFV